MIDVNVKFTGFKEATFLLKTLPRKVQARVIKQSLRRGAAVIQKAAKSIAPVKTGTIRRSLKVRTGRSILTQVYADSGTGAANDGWYAHIIERGSKPHSLAPGSQTARAGSANRRARAEIRQNIGRQHPGTAPRRFMLRATNRSFEPALKAITNRFEQLLIKELAK